MIERLYLTRRGALAMLGAPFLAGLNSGCQSFLSKDLPAGLEVKREPHWARREAWSGREMVFGVAIQEDRYLMVRHNSPLGWAFPGGEVEANGNHGPRTPDNLDLLNAVVDYTYSQAMVRFSILDTKLFAYGYAIDPINDRNVLVHWFNIGLASRSLPRPHANLVDVSDARWLGIDHSDLGRCVRMRIGEYQDARQGGSLIMGRCG